MDSMEKILLPYDTSLTIMVEAQKRNHRIFYAEPKNFLLDQKKLAVDVREVWANQKRGFKVLCKKRIDASQVDVILIRKDPPFDLEYLYMTYLLETISDQTLCINSPKGIRDANEKLFSFQFKKWVPPSIVTSNLEEILSFQENLRSDVILKPLNQKGGSGILLLPKNSKRKSQIIGRATKAGTQTILAQKFLKKGLTSGDKRILLLDGEILGAFGRIPKRGEFRANLSLGGTSKKVTITNRERVLVHELKPTLKKRGLIFVGLDLIDGFLTEINVTSPAGIFDINELYGTALESKVVDWIEAHC